MFRLSRVALFALFSLPWVSQAPAQDVEIWPDDRREAPSAEAADKSRGMALMSATVANDGTLVRGSGAVTSTLASAGSYNVKFNRSVEDCTCLAGFGESNGSAIAYLAQNYISANCPYADADNVRVWIIKGGTDATSAFHLLVFCPK